MAKMLHHSSKHIYLFAVVSLMDLMDLLWRNCHMKDTKLRKGRVLVTRVNIVTCTMTPWVIALNSWSRACLTLRKVISSVSVHLFWLLVKNQYVLREIEENFAAKLRSCNRRTVAKETVITLTKMAENVRVAVRVRPFISFMLQY